MGLETGTYISDLNASNPASGDPKSQGDDHIRLIKSTVKTTFPNISGAVTPTHTELNYVDGVTSAIQTQLDGKQPFDSDLTAIAGLASNGLVAKTGSGTAAVRTITAPAAGITVTNGDGVSGNPTLALANDLSALEGLSSTGVIVRTGDGTATTRTLTAGAGCTITYGDGVSGNPVIALTPSVGTGDVNGPSSATDGNVALFDGITGKIIKESAIKTINGESILGSGDIETATTVRNAYAYRYMTTTSDSFVVPDGVTSIRAYAIGKGGDTQAGTATTTANWGVISTGGGGGGMAYGDIAVTPGQTVTIDITAGVAKVTYGGTDLLTANPGTDGSTRTAATTDSTTVNGGTGGTATKHASVTNGGAYTGGNGYSGRLNSSAGGGASAASPLGNGINGAASSGGSSIAYAGSTGGAAGLGGNSADAKCGGGAGSSGASYRPGGPRTFDTFYTDPLLIHANLGTGAYYQSTTTMQMFATPGGGGASQANLGLHPSSYPVINGSDFGGGGFSTVTATATDSFGGHGGFLAGGGYAYGAVTCVQATGGNGGIGGGSGGAYCSRSDTVSRTTNASTGGSAAVVIFY